MAGLSKNYSLHFSYDSTPLQRSIVVFILLTVITPISLYSPGPKKDALYKYLLLV